MHGKRREHVVEKPTPVSTTTSPPSSPKVSSMFVSFVWRTTVAARSISFSPKRAKSPIYACSFFFKEPLNVLCDHCVFARGACRDAQGGHVFKVPHRDGFGQKALVELLCVRYAQNDEVRNALYRLGFSGKRCAMRSNFCCNSSRESSNLRMAASASARFFQHGFRHFREQVLTLYGDFTALMARTSFRCPRQKPTRSAARPKALEHVFKMSKLS